MHDASFSEVARLAIAVEDGVKEARIELGEDLGDEDRVEITGAPIRDCNSRGITSHLHGPVKDRVQRIARDDDGDGARCMVRHIEQGAVRCQGAAARLGAHRDLLHFPAQHEVHDRDGAADPVDDVRRPVGRMDGHAARLEADGNLGQLIDDVIAVCVFHLNQRETVRLTVDDDETCLVRGQGNGRRAARRCPSAPTRAEYRPSDHNGQEGGEAH